MNFLRFFSTNIRRDSLGTFFGFGNLPPPAPRQGAALVTFLMWQ